MVAVVEIPFSSGMSFRELIVPHYAASVSMTSIVNEVQFHPHL